MADRTVLTGKQYGIDVEKIKSVTPETLQENVKRLGLFLKYTPTKSMKTDFIKGTAPITRVCNGVTHYMLYLRCVELDEPIMILEHDAYFVGTPVSYGILDGVIQISSHNTYQMNAAQMKKCVRAQKMFSKDPEYQYDDNWDERTGLIEHPLSGTNGTSGYIIGPKAAEKMIDYIKKDGVAFADRIRTEHVGEGNLFIQYPFSVFCGNL